MITLFYSPHATSVDNEMKRASGHVDVPLSKLGRQRAWEIGQQYATMALDVVFCSDLQRASKTAEIAFAQRGVPIIPDVRLREFDYGDMTQFPLAQVEAEFVRRITEPFPNGESALMVAERVGAFLRDVLREYDGKTIVVIGHRATKYGIAYWCGNTALETIVRTPWEWRDVPIWRYELHTHDLEKGLIV